ncbi:hypothetical protein D3C83_304140 [compost metagenome]
MLETVRPFHGRITLGVEAGYFVPMAGPAAAGFVRHQDGKLMVGAVAFHHMLRQISHVSLL